MIPAAPLRRRMAAFVYEGVLLFGVLMGAGLIYGVLTQQRHALEGRHGLQAFVLIVLASYFVGLWMHGGQTLPLKTWRIQVLDASDQPLRLGRAVWRFTLASVAWFLPPILLIMLEGWQHTEKAAATYALTGWIAVYAAASRWLPDGQFLHDQLAGTRMVDLRAPASPPAQSPA